MLSVNLTICKLASTLCKNSNNDSSSEFDAILMKATKFVSKTLDDAACFPSNLSPQSLEKILDYVKDLDLDGSKGSTKVMLIFL